MVTSRYLDERLIPTTMDIISGMKISQLISYDILDNISAEQDNFSTTDTNCSIGGYLKEIIIFMQKLALQKDVIITADIPPECYDTIKCDAIRIQQVFFNVLQNAIQYTSGVMDAWVRVNVKIIRPAM